MRINVSFIDEEHHTLIEVVHEGTVPQGTGDNWANWTCFKISCHPGFFFVRGTHSVCFSISVLNTNHL